MPIIKIADLIIDIHNKYEYLRRQCAAYTYDGAKPPDITVEATDREIAADNPSGSELSAPYAESICIYRKLALKALEYDTLLMHGSVIEYRGRGIIFLAASGVGKTTHTMLWKTVFGDKVTVINGDKPLIRFLNGDPYAYGTPWAGKEGYQTDRCVELTDICFINRNDVNKTVSAESGDCLNGLMKQVLHPTDSFNALKTLELVDALSKRCRFWNAFCNTDPQAAEAAENAIMNENINIKRSEVIK